MEMPMLDEYKHVMELIQGSSVVPEGANLRYHLISMDWFKRWQAFTSSHESLNEEPGFINNENDLRSMVVTKDVFGVDDYF